jgi:hypothetical protein
MPKPKIDVLQVELLETEKGYVEAVALAFVPPLKTDLDSNRTAGECMHVTCWGGKYNGMSIRLYPDNGQDGCVIGPALEWLPAQLRVSDSQAPGGCPASPACYVLVKNVKGDVILAPSDELEVAFRKTRPPKKTKKAVAPVCRSTPAPDNAVNGDPSLYQVPEEEAGTLLQYP